MWTGPGRCNIAFSPTERAATWWSAISPIKAAVQPNGVEAESRIGAAAAFRAPSWKAKAPPFLLQAPARLSVRCTITAPTFDIVGERIVVTIDGVAFPRRHRLTTSTFVGEIFQRNTYNLLQRQRRLRHRRRHESRPRVPCLSPAKAFVKEVHAFEPFKRNLRTGCKPT